jgi:hypothetical protein
MKRGQVYLGIGYEMINFEDNQTVRNHTKATHRPELMVGPRVRFNGALFT